MEEMKQAWSILEDVPEDVIWLALLFTCIFDSDFREEALRRLGSTDSKPPVSDSCDSRCV